MSLFVPFNLVPLPLEARQLVLPLDPSPHQPRALASLSACVLLSASTLVQVPSLTAFSAWNLHQLPPQSQSVRRYLNPARTLPTQMALLLSQPFLCARLRLEVSLWATSPLAWVPTSSRRTPWVRLLLNALKPPSLRLVSRHSPSRVSTLLATQFFSSLLICHSARLLLGLSLRERR